MRRLWVVVAIALAVGAGLDRNAASRLTPAPPILPPPLQAGHRDRFPTPTPSPWELTTQITSLPRPVAF